jgi:hypothetical protein
MRSLDINPIIKTFKSLGNSIGEFMKLLDKRWYNKPEKTDHTPKKIPTDNKTASPRFIPKVWKRRANRFKVVAKTTAANISSKTSLRCHNIYKDIPKAIKPIH